jgi:hypothetical protein
MIERAQNGRGVGAQLERNLRQPPSPDNIVKERNAHFGQSSIQKAFRAVDRLNALDLAHALAIRTTSIVFGHAPKCMKDIL